MTDEDRLRNDLTKYADMLEAREERRRAESAACQGLDHGPTAAGGDEGAEGGPGPDRPEGEAMSKIIPDPDRPFASAIGSALIDLRHKLSAALERVRALEKENAFFREALSYRIEQNLQKAINTYKATPSGSPDSPSGGPHNAGAGLDSPDQPRPATILLGEQP